MKKVLRGVIMLGCLLGLFACTDYVGITEIVEYSHFVVQDIKFIEYTITSNGPPETFRIEDLQKINAVTNCISNLVVKETKNKIKEGAMLTLNMIYEDGTTFTFRFKNGLLESNKKVYQIKNDGYLTILNLLQA